MVAPSTVRSSTKKPGAASRIARSRSDARRSGGSLDGWVGPFELLVDLLQLGPSYERVGEYGDDGKARDGRGKKGEEQSGAK